MARIATISRKQPRTEQERLFEAWLGSAETVWLTCRVMGHWWPDYDRLAADDKLGVRRGGYILEMTCDRGCGVGRRSYLTSSFSPDRGSNSYTYPRGYQLPEYAGGGWNFTRDMRARVRHELYSRARREHGRPEEATES